MIEALSALVVLTSPPTIEEGRIIDAAIHRCPGAAEPDLDLLLGLLRMEELAGVPYQMRGILLAAACTESRYTPDGRRGDDGRAVGLLQQWPWVESWCGIDRSRPVEAAYCWLGLVVRQLPKVERLCSWRTEYRRWVAAQVRAVRYPRPDTDRCRETSAHYRVLKRWRRM